MRAELSPLELMLQGKSSSVSPEARHEFAFLLGTFSRNHGVPHRQRRKYDKTFFNAKTIERIRRIAGILGTHEPKIHSLDTIRFYDPRLTRALHGALDQEFHSYVADDSERIEFLRGFFASSLAGVKEVGGTLGYYLNFSEWKVRNYVLSALFELGIYPCIPRENIALQNIFNLRRFQELDLDHDEDNKKVVRQFLEQYPDQTLVHPPTYYAVRKKIQELAKQQQKISWAPLSREFGVSVNALPRWVNDIIPNQSSIPARKPLTVINYEDIVRELALPNVYLASAPIHRYEKVFVPMGIWVYQVAEEAKSKLSAALGKASPPSDEDLMFLQSQLQNSYAEGRWLKYSATRDLITEIEAAPAPGAILLRTPNHIFVLPYEQQQRYLYIYDPKDKSLDDECIAHLQEELRSFLDDHSLLRQRKYRSDLFFKIENQVIRDLSFRHGATGARRWDDNTQKKSDHSEKDSP